MALSGRVLAVNSRTYGASLTADVLAGTTTVPVDDTTDFPEDGGVVYHDMLGLLDYTSVDHDALTLTLAEGLGDDLEEGERFDLWDTDNDRPYAETVALVAVGGEHFEGDPIEAVVDQALVPLLPEGIREGRGESVTLEGEGRVRVVNIVGMTPRMDGVFMDPGTVTTTDGEAPGESPDPIVRAGLLSLFVSWEPIENADPVTYDVHVSTTPGFVPSDSTLTGSAVGAGPVVIRALADGTLMDAESTYYVKIVARDEDGPAPASNEESGQVALVNHEDLAVDVIIAGDIYSNDGYFGRINVSQLDSGGLSASIAVLGELLVGDNISIAPTTGFQVRTSQGLTHFPTDNSRGRIASDITAYSMEILGNLEIRGTDNMMANGSELRLAQGVTEPAGPILRDALSAAPTSTPITLPLTGTGFAWDEVNQVFYRHNYYTMTAYGMDGDELVVDDDLSFDPIAAFDPEGDPLRALYMGYGVAVAPSGDFLAVIAQLYDSDLVEYRWYILRYVFDGSGWVYDGRVPVPDADGGQQPIIASYSDTEVLVLSVGSGHRARIYSYDVTDGTNSLLATLRDGDGAVTMTSLPRFVYYGPGDYSDGQDRFVVSTAAGRLYVADDTGLLNDDEGANLAVMIRDVAWSEADGTFLVLYGDRVEPMSPFTETVTTSFGYSWARYSNDRLSCTARTVLGGVIEDQTIPARSWPRLTIPSRLPDAATSVEMYAADSLDAFHLIATIHEEDDTLEYVFDAPLDLTGIAPAGSTYGFDAYSEPALIRSDAEDANGALIQLLGDGSGRVGPFQWDDNGDVVDAPWDAPATWTPVTFQNGAKNYGYETTAYTRAGGMGHLKGLVQLGSTATQNTVIFTLPVGYRPPELTHHLVAYSGGSGTLRININTNGTVTLNQNATANSWISLSGVVYALAPSLVKSAPLGVGLDGEPLERSELNLPEGDTPLERLDAGLTSSDSLTLPDTPTTTEPTTPDLKA